MGPTHKQYQSKCKMFKKFFDDFKIEDIFNNLSNFFYFIINVQPIIYCGVFFIIGQLNLSLYFY